MPFFAILGAIGLITSVVGLGIQQAGYKKQEEASKTIASASSANEDVRQQQTALEAERQRRQSIRNTLRARSQALVAGAAQGASQGSGLQGGLAQVTGQGAENTLGINQAKTQSDSIFSNNRTIAQAGAVSAQGQGLTAFGGGLSSLGQNISGLRIG